MQKYIFLDIDGVLSPERLKKQKEFDLEKLWGLAKKFEENKDLSVLVYLSNIICPHKVQLLKESIDKHNAKIVIHSSWLYFPGEEITFLIMKMFKLDYAFPEKWNVAEKEHRSKEYNILNYINNNNVSNYIVIDDEFISGIPEENQVNPNEEFGLVKEDYERINSLINKN